MQCTIYPEPRGVKRLAANCHLSEHPASARETAWRQALAASVAPAVAFALALALVLAGLLPATAGSSAARAQGAAILPPAEPAVALEWAWIVPADQAADQAVDEGLDGPVEGERLADSLSPGGGHERLYTGRFRYQGADAVPALRIVLPVPAGMHYLPGSATGPGAEIAYSVDGGRTFAPPETLRAMRAAPGARLRTRRARAAEYTHIQWLLAGEFVPGISGLVSFRARPATAVTGWRRLDGSGGESPDES